MRKPELAKTLFPKSDAFLAKLPGQAKIFCVGGAVRDLLLGSPSSDRDYVVVGVTVDDMLHAGFAPVGKDFPVFLHPQSHDEYALARTERKSGKGYKGFVFSVDPSVTLEEDLGRRDLTINAIAINSSGDLIDPYKGIDDLQNKTLRHVSSAFSEDPVRLLRLARFLARWPEFEVASETQDLCKEMVANGEASALVAERVWQEIQTGLMERQPSRMIGLLQRCGAWQAITQNAPPIEQQTLQRLEQAAQKNLPLEARFGLLIHNLGGASVNELQFKAPKACQEFAALLARATQNFPQELNRPEGLLDWLFSTDFQRKPDRFSILLECLGLEGAMPSTIALLRDIAAFFDTPAALEKIASAAREAQEKKSSVKQAVEQARLSLAKKHPAFSQRR